MHSAQEGPGQPSKFSECGCTAQGTHKGTAEVATSELGLLAFPAQAFGIISVTLHMLGKVAAVTANRQ